MLGKGRVYCRKPVAGMPAVAYTLVSCLQTAPHTPAAVTSAVPQSFVLSPGQAPPDLVAQLNKSHPFFRATQGERKTGDRTSTKQTVICACSGRKGSMKTRSLCHSEHLQPGGRHTPAGRSAGGFITASTADSRAAPPATHGCFRTEPDVPQAEEMRQGRCWQPQQRRSPMFLFHLLETGEEISVVFQLGMGTTEGVNGVYQVLS